ncbi:hypothetical protein ACIGNX_06450 [Actinosynnema sp. NPDC053489]|uniref:hypothetical protein n=1 Tax=Actinosynnema sp. NPDC053489 TaxID=3363916 RepID=UPI0037C99D5E
MAEGTHRKKSSAVLRIGLVVLGVLVLLGVVQAVTTGTVGVGAVSVTLRETTPRETTPAAVAPPSTGPVEWDGAVGGVSSEPSGGAAPSPSGEAEVVTGSWKQARGLLTVEVTRVENAAGRLRLFVTAVNASTARMDLPVASISVVDDKGGDYGVSPSSSRWPVSIARNASVNGVLELDREVGAGGGAVSLTFAGIIGQLAPTGGSVTVPDIPIPR